MEETCFGLRMPQIDFSDIAPTNLLNRIDYFRLNTIMPTGRAWVLLGLALALYFLANQTQVGWVYIISNGIVGLLLATWLYGWGLLRQLDIRRTVLRLNASTHADWAAELNAPVADTNVAANALHENDAVQIKLRLTYGGYRPTFMLHGDDDCPFAPEEEQSQRFFVPFLAAKQTLDLAYQTTCDRRGLHQLKSLPLHTRGPFGLFRTRHTLHDPQAVLVYPDYHPLKRFRLFERHAQAEQQRLKIGAGSEVISLREYRMGDSFRHIHWRSAARRGELIVKEMADDSQLNLTVVLDLSQQGNVGVGKYSTFEVAIRIAATLGYYANQKNIPFHLVGSNRQGRLPQTALSWWGTLNYLAKVRNDGEQPLAHLLSRSVAFSFAVVLVSHPTHEVCQTLTTLARRGATVWPIFVTLDGVLPDHLPMPAHGQVVSPTNWVEMLERSDFLSKAGM